MPASWGRYNYRLHGNEQTIYQTIYHTSGWETRKGRPVGSILSMLKTPKILVKQIHAPSLKVGWIQNKLLWRLSHPTTLIVIKYITYCVLAYSTVWQCFLPKGKQARPEHATAVQCTTLEPTKQKGSINVFLATGNQEVCFKICFQVDYVVSDLLQKGLKFP